MSKLNPLSPEDIEEELVNNEILSSGAIDDEEHLNDMNLEEKKNFLIGINQSREEYKTEVPLKAAAKLDGDAYPSLPSPGKTNTTNRLKLPRKPSTGTKTEPQDTKSTNLLDDDDVVIVQKSNKFCLPLFARDDAPPLKLPQRPLHKPENPYFVKLGENPEAALKRMLTHHIAWKTSYLNELRKLKLKNLGIDEEIEDTIVEKSDSQRSDSSLDPYEFNSESPLRVTKTYTGAKKREPIQKYDSESQSNNKIIQRRTSRDSDCQEVEPTSSKPDDPKLGDFIPAHHRQRNKRNRKQLVNTSQPTEDRPDVKFDFDNTWEPTTGAWQSPSYRSPLNNQVSTRRTLPKTPVVEEEKVQCPICQRNFAKSKVEQHAATCEGYSELPMDYEESN